MLYHEKVSWLDDYNRIELREVNNQLVNYIEDLDSINEKITLIKDELTNIRSDQMNQRMYVLSIISVIFLPLSFLTGLFGINVGGIPGAQDSSSFEIFSVLLIGIGFLQFLILKNINGFKMEEKIIELKNYLLDAIGNYKKVILKNTLMILQKSLKN